MFQRDYLMRMIEEAAQVLARLLGLREKGDYIRALDVADETFSGLLSLQWEYLASLPDEEFVTRLVEDHQLEAPQWEVLADLLKEKGILLKAMERGDESRSCFLKSLHVYEHLDRLEPDLMSWDRMNKISFLREEIDAGDFD